MKSFYCLFMILALMGCSKELRYSKEELYAKAKASDPTVTFILPRSLSEGVDCAEYSEGCIAGHNIQVQRLDLIAVEFETEEQAKYAAKKFRGYYVRNWLLDDVSGEPLLERFVEKSLEAKKP